MQLKAVVNRKYAVKELLATIEQLRKELTEEKAYATHPPSFSPIVACIQYTTHTAQLL